MTTYTLQQLVDTTKGTKPWFEQWNDLANYVKTNAADISNLAVGSAPGFGSAFDSRFTVNDTGAVNTITFTPTPAPIATDSLVAGMFWIVKPNHNCTGTTTITVGLIPGTTPARKSDDNGNIIELGANDYITNRHAIFVFDGTQFLLANPSTNWGAIAATGGTIAGVTFTDATNIIQTIHSANATHTFNTRTHMVMAEVWGAGGSGSKDTSGGATPGAAGGYAQKIFVKPAATATIVVGAGGAGVSADPSNGNAGGTSSYTDGTNTLSCTGGGGGILATRATAGTASGGNKNESGADGAYVGTMNAPSQIPEKEGNTGTGSTAVGTGGSGSTANGGNGQVIVTEYLI